MDIETARLVEALNERDKRRSRGSRRLADLLPPPPQQQQSGGGGGMNIAKNFIPSGASQFSNSGYEAIGDVTGGADIGEGGGNWGAASNPYVWLAALLGWKAEDSRKRSGVDFDDQLRNISLAPQKDADRWQLEKYMPLGGKDVYKGTFDLASGDISNWWDSLKAPWRALRNKL